MDIDDADRLARRVVAITTPVRDDDDDDDVDAIIPIARIVVRLFTSSVRTNE